jgi:hypothetical protein
MTDINIFDLNNKNLFPVLNSIETLLNKFIPLERDYIDSPEKYIKVMGFDDIEDEKVINKDANNKGLEDAYDAEMEGAERDLFDELEKRQKYYNVVHVLTGLMIEFNYSNETFQLIKDLKKERDFTLATSSTGEEQRDYNSRAYNKYVIDIIGLHMSYFETEIAYQNMEGVIIAYRHVNFRKYFNEWDCFFMPEDDSYQIETQLPTAEIVIDPLPEFKFKNGAQIITWLYELGVLDTILNKCKEGETYNLRRTANVINSFTQINLETIRQDLAAIYKPSDANKKNNPLNNPDNIKWVVDMAVKFKLNKEN